MPNAEQLELFLRKVDKDFPVPLSSKQELKEFAKKLSQKATLCVACEGDELLALVAGYTDALTDGMAYISVVATLEKARGKGLAKRLMGEFIDICKQKNIKAVHLYTVPSNIPAVSMYKSLGFADYFVENEPRPEDTHLIYYLD